MPRPIQKVSTCGTIIVPPSSVNLAATASDSGRNLGDERSGKGGSKQKTSRCLKAQVVNSTPQSGSTRLFG